MTHALPLSIHCSVAATPTRCVSRRAGVDLTMDTGMTTMTGTGRCGRVLAVMFASS